MVLSYLTHSIIILRDYWMSTKMWSLIILSYCFYNFTNQCFHGNQVPYRMQQNYIFRVKWDKGDEPCSLDTQIIDNSEKLLQIQLLIWNRLGHVSLLICTTRKIPHICSNQPPYCLNGGWTTPLFPHLWYYTEGTYI